MYGEHRCKNTQIQCTAHVLTLQVRFISKIYGYYMICKSINVCNTLTKDKKDEIISTDKEKMLQNAIIARCNKTQ